MNRNKKCRVCGDKAIGFNFNVLTCGSCRIFFHRNVDKYNELKCPKFGKCDIDTLSRKCCTKCRLDKCLESGMKRREFDPNDVRSNNVNLKPIDHYLEENIKNQVIQCTVEQSSPSSSSSSSTSSSSCQELSLIPYEYQNNIPYTPRYIDPVMLNAHELRLIAYLQKANSVFEDEHSVRLVGVANSVAQTFNMPAIYATRIVKFCKYFIAFNDLDKENQLSLIKPFFPELMAVRIAYLYDKEKDGFPLIENESGNQALFITPSLFKGMQKRHLLEANRSYLRGLKWEMDNDPTIRDIIISLSLFRPREGFACNEALRYKYFQYYNLLRRYLEHKYYNVEVAKQKFQRLIQILNQISLVRDNYRDLLLEIAGQFGEVVHLLAEVFDLT